MDNRRLVIVTFLSLAVFFGWEYLTAYLNRKYPLPQAPAPTTVEATTQSGTQPTTGNVEMTAAAQPPSTASALQVVGGEAQPAELGYSGYDPGGKNPYSIGLSIDPQGAGIQRVVLNRFSKEVRGGEPYSFQQRYDHGPADLAVALAARAIVVEGQMLDLAGVTWKRLEATEASATYGVDIKIAGSEKPLVLTKQYTLRPAKAGEGQPQAFGYEVALTYALKNQTGRALKVKLLFNGPNVPEVETTRDIPEVVTGHNIDEKEKGDVGMAHTSTASFAVEKPPTSVLDKKGPLLWAGFTSNYFDAIVRPPTVNGRAAYIADVRATAVLQTPERREVNLTFETTELDLEAGGELSVPLEVYLGPRQREILNSPYYSSFPLKYDETLVLSGGFCGICTFPWLISGLFYLLRAFHTILRDWGLAIIALVLMVRLLLHPITKRSQVSMSRMTKMGPEIERLKKKYGEDKEELNKAMMEVYKQQGFTPILGCLPMLLQTPIWIALWQALQSTFELRHASFLGFTWIHDLAQPDMLYKFSSPIPLLFFGWHLDSINLLPILMGVVFYVQQKMQPQPVATTPEQAQQQKMMKWVSLIFPVMLYTGPAGLNLYILTSTAIGIWESKRVRDHIKMQEEREKAGRVIVDAPATRTSKRLARAEKPVEAKSGCITGWLANLQEKAESLRNDQDKRGKKK